MKLEARRSALRLISQTIRAVLREAASEALRRLLTERLKDIKDDKACDEEGNVNQDELDELPVLLSDIDHSYAVATRLGEKWEEKLLEAGENDAASIVRVVLSTGRFLEEDIIDEFPMPAGHTATQTLQRGNNLGVRNNVSFQSEPNNNQLSLSRQGPSNENSNLGEHRPIPFGMLLNLGWKWDLSQSTDEAFPFVLKPTSTQWKALPPYNPPDSAALHIPKATILPEHEIKAQHPDQLYGYPSPSIHMSYAHSHLSSLSSITRVDDNDAGFYRDQIHLIDAAFGNADEKKHPTSWYHGWDCIQRAVNKNRDRMYLETIAGRKRKHPKLSSHVDLEYEHHEIIPKSFITQGSIVTTGTTVASTSTPSLDANTSRTDFTIVPIVKVISSNTRVAILLDEKRQHTSLQRKQQEEAHSPSHVREPCSISSQSWTMNEIKNEMSSDMDQRILKTMVHKDMEEEYLRESEFHHIEGALKHVGLVHLWEQKRLGSMKDEDEGNMSTKKKAKIVKKARKMRLWPHTLEKQEKTGDKLQKSKVIWSESFMKQDVLGGSEEDSKLLHKYWMEFDLGECMLQFMSSEDGSVNKTAMAFRSLEISALVE